MVSRRIFLGVETLDFEIVRGYLGSHGEQGVFEIGGGGLGARHVYFDVVADAAPDVGLPVGAAGGRDIGEGTGAHEGPAEAVLRLLDSGERDSAVDGGPESSAGDLDGGDGGAIVCGGCLDGLVVDQDLFFEGVELGVGVDFPPASTMGVVTGLADFPAGREPSSRVRTPGADLLEDRTGVKVSGGAGVYFGPGEHRANEALSSYVRKADRDRGARS